ncbi:hypothetical protein FS749_000596 [Ceratobasidium sp. UAMH 11750]|nr:hypothetical protein FS749_000596 [Ceratobasidium sp. UAMH 11750]
MVLHLPEIATLICSFLPRSDCARLCYTSRTVFSAAAPFVWWSIDGPRLLRTLLERVEFPPIDHLSQFPRIKIAFRDEDRIDHFFSRFDVYAPYVKVLHVYGTGILYYRVEGWSVLISRARKHALLPNLRKLHFKMPHKPHPPDYFMWMTTFYSSSLVDISITPSDSDAPPLISYRTASLVLKSLMQHCPKIQRLSLLPNRELNSHYKDRETTILACLPVDPFYRYMNAATSLRHLTGTFAWFQENALLVLGRLPNLERIDICSSSDIPFKHMGSLLPAGSFSALRRWT